MATPNFTRECIHMKQTKQIPKISRRDNLEHNAETTYTHVHSYLGDV